MLKESDILFESGDYWITSAPYGYDVYKVGITHSTRCARIGYKGQEGMEKSKAEIIRRQDVDKGR